MTNPCVAGRSFDSCSRSNLLVLLLTVTALAVADRAFAEPSQSRASSVEFDIPAQFVPAALSEFARQAQVQLFFISDGFENIQANEVVGTYSAQEALDLLLAGTGLAASYSAESGVKVRAVSASMKALTLGSQLVSATAETADGQDAGESNDSQAQRFRRYAMTGDSNEEQKSGAALEEIVVTGSNIRGVDNVGGATIIFDRDELAKTGFSTIEELFESIPQNLDEITAVGGIATGASILAGFNTQGASGINLRGLGPGSTLVLFNGKRRPGNINGRVVDVSAIPFAMVERVELVTGGHSAIYGSDAVAGVVNVITRTEFDGAETQIYYGQSSAGGERFNFSQAFGREFEKGGFVFGYDYRNDQPLDATDTGVLRSPSPVGLAPIPGLFHIRGAAKQHVGLFAGHFDMTGKAELYADAQIAVDEYEHQLAYQIAGCCDFDGLTITDSNQYSAAGGIRLDVGKNWEVDVSALHGSVDNSAADGSVLGFPDGTITSVDPRPAAIEEDNDEAKLTSVSAVADGPLGTFGHSAISAAIGVDFRDESYLRTTTPVATGALEAFENIDRNVWSIFGEVHLPLLNRNGRRFEVSLAGRYDDYSDFGDTFNPQLGLEWEPVSGMTLRGSFSQAFRAPNLFELSLETRVRVRTLVDPLDPTGATTANVFIDTGGNPGLRPEEADTYTLGVDWLPSDRTKLSVSYFNIEYVGRIDTPDSFSGGFAALENELLYPNLINRNPTPEQVDAILSRASRLINDSGIPYNAATDDPFTTFPNIIIFDNRSNNISLDAMDGFDVQASVNLHANSGDWFFGLNGTHYLDFERSITATSPTVDRLNQPGRPVDLRLRGHVGWSRLAWNAEVYVNYVDSYGDNTVDPAVPIDSWTTIDMTLGFNASEVSESGFLNGLTATLGFNNVLDEDPPLMLNNVFGLGYDAVNANAVGRFVSLHFSKRW